MFSASTEDFSQRDRSIRINSYTTVRRRSPLDVETFHNYWRDVHGPLCARLPGLSWYVQHHFATEHDDHLWLMPDGVKAFDNYVLDGMVEIGFASSSDQASFKSASPILFSDEQNIFDETVAYNLPSGSKTFIDRMPDGIPNGPETVDRLHVHFHAAHADQGAFAEHMEKFASALAGNKEVLKVRLHLPEPHDNRKADPPAPNVEHVVSTSRTMLAMLEIAFGNPLIRRQFLASGTFAALNQDQQKHVKRIAAFRVSGVYTYIRDGELTTAGLRGSRAAELIQRLGALNQLEPDVRKIIKTGAL